MKRNRAKNRNKLMTVISLGVFFYVLFGCSRDENFIGTYTCKHEFGKESITLNSNHTFLQIFTDGNTLDSNQGTWRVEPDFLVLDGWVLFKAPIQSEDMKSRLSEGKKKFVFTHIVDNCIIIEEDLPEFNPCKKIILH